MDETAQKSRHNVLLSKADFDAFDLPSHIIYLNCASLAPRLKSVTTAGRLTIDRMAEPWKVRSNDWFEKPSALAAMFAHLIGAAPHSTTLVSSVSYGIAVAALNIPVKSGANIVVVDQEYPSNYYSWYKRARNCGASIRSVSEQPGLTLTDAVVSAIDRNTAVVAVPNCRWTDGLLLDLPRIGEVARNKGAALVVDGSQSIGAYPIDVAEIQPDFVVSVGYKWLLGPYGLAYLYAADRWHEKGEALEESWLHRAGSENFAGLVDYTDNYKPGAERFGQGAAAQFYLAQMAIAALSQIASWTPARIHQQLTAWTEELCRRVAGFDLIAPKPNQRAGHMIGLRSGSTLPSDLAASLADRDIYVGVRGTCIRVAPHLHCGADGLDHLVRQLQDLLR